VSDFFTQLAAELDKAANARVRDRSAAANAAPSRRRKRWRIALVAIAGSAVVAVPAWATGLIHSVLVRDDEPLTVGNERGAKYVLASGDASPELRYRLVAYRASVPTGSARSPHMENGLCVLLQLKARRGARGHPSLTVTCAGGSDRLAFPGRRSGIAGYRTSDVRAGLVAPEVASVAIVLSSGRRLTVVPNTFDPGSIKRAGLPFPFRYFAFVAPRGQRIIALVARTADGSVVHAEGEALSGAARGPTLRSPVILQ
jgi:hypothetical protein